jgi:hypothetical protein
MRFPLAPGIIAWLVLAAASCGCARSFGRPFPDLPNNYRLALLQADRFHEVEQVRGLPSAVATACFGTAKVADPKGNWSIGCTPITPDEPFTHMAWAATDGSLWVVAWERGGIYYDGDVALFRLESGGRAKLVWGRMLDQPRTKTSEKRPPTSFKEFQRLLE